MMRQTSTGAYLVVPIYDLFSFLGFYSPKAVADQHWCFFGCSHQWSLEFKFLVSTFHRPQSPQSLQYWVGCFMGYSSTHYDFWLRVLFNLWCGRPALVLFRLFPYMIFGVLVFWVSTVHSPQSPPSPQCLVGCFLGYGSTHCDFWLRVLFNLRCGRPALVLFFWLFR